MKRFLAAIVIPAALILPAAYGQPMIQSGSQPAAQSEKTSIPPLIASLNLSDSQKKKLAPVYEERDKKLDALKQDKSLSEADRRARVSEINQQINEQLRVTLTQGQKKKLAELRRK
ncbi:MAG TPA: hypothetical protein VFD58_05830 [Blastocatellia bacterium]|nr:hypothetical protein [Blastocatellia bacterium]